jgi:erythromycin esterase
MAENVAWILGQNPDAKIVLWAHNGHVNRTGPMMGSHLDRQFGEAHLPIGFATARGTYQAIKAEKGLVTNDLNDPPEGSIEAVFVKAGHPRFILDLRKADADNRATAMLATMAPFRSIGALAMDLQFSPQNLKQAFDAVIYIEETTAAVPMGGRDQAKKRDK